MNYELKQREQVNARGITIEDSYWEFARKLGRGNASRGIRIALYRTYLAEKEHDLQPTTKQSTMES